MHNRRQCTFAIKRKQNIRGACAVLRNFHILTIETKVLRNVNKFWNYRAYIYKIGEFERHWLQIRMDPVMVEISVIGRLILVFLGHLSIA